MSVIELKTKIANLESRLAGAHISAANRTILTKLLEKAKADLMAKTGSVVGHNVLSTPDVLSTQSNDGGLPPKTSVRETFEDVLDIEHNPHQVIDRELQESALPEFTYNEKQQRAIDVAASGKSLVLTGPAGSGKTTTLKGIVNKLIDMGHLGQLHGGTHKYLPIAGGPGIVLTAFTNKAVENIKKHLSADLQRHCITIHKLLEFEPTEDPVTDPETGKTKRNFRFEPARDRNNPLSSSIKVIIIDEASMVGVDLWNLLVAALPHKVQIIFVGDIQQLPPVFGKSIFIHAMQRGIETVELTEVHRQAKESPILSLAHRILDGKMIPAPQLEEWNIDKSATGMGQTIMRVWKKSYGPDAATILMQKTLCKEIDAGNFNPEKDVVLTLFNDNFGVNSFNTAIASHYAAKLNAEVWEIFASTSKIYLRIGERVLVNKVEHRVVDIKKNPAYTGKHTRKPSNTMDYSGVERDRSKMGVDAYDDGGLPDGEDAIDFIDSVLESMESTTDGDSPARRAGSHIVKVRSVETGYERELRASGDLIEMKLGYALTVHKSQGSEYDTVYFVTHKCQQFALFRELLYTAVTRAKNRLVAMCEPSTFVAGINTQRLVGKTIEEKIAGFDRWLKLENSNGPGNVDQIPKDLDRFLVAV